MKDREIIEAIATKVMGFRRVTSLEGEFVRFAGSDGYALPPESEDWNPLTNAEHSRQVREKLRERWEEVNLMSWASAMGEWRYRLMLNCDKQKTYCTDDFEEDTTANTEEMAVALAALKAIGETHE